MKFTKLENGRLEINYEDDEEYPYIYTTILPYTQIEEKILNNMDGYYIEQPDVVEEDFDASLFDGSLNSAAELSEAIYKNANELVERKSIQLYLAECILTAEEYINRSHQTINIIDLKVFEDAVLRLVASELWGKFNIPQMNNIQEALVSTPRANYLEKTAYKKLKRFIKEKMVAI